MVLLPLLVVNSLLLLLRGQVCFILLKVTTRVLFATEHVPIGAIKDGKVIKVIRDSKVMAFRDGRVIRDTKAIRAYKAIKDCRV